MPFIVHKKTPDSKVGQRKVTSRLVLLLTAVTFETCTPKLLYQIYSTRLVLLPVPSHTRLVTFVGRPNKSELGGVRLCPRAWTASCI
jgi:hypothetical protein